MSSMVLSGDTSGTVTVTVPAVAGTNTATIPAATGTVMVSGNMPAFSASLSANQTGISSGVFTKVTFNSKNWDTASCYDSATNYRFTPNVAGYYIVTSGIDSGATSACSRGVPAIYKNGSIYRSGTNIGTVTIYSGVVSAQVYLNGTTDYIELYAYIAGTSPVISATANTWFDAVLVRTA